MRLCAKLLLRIRKDIGVIQLNMWDALTPKYFESIVRPAICCANPSMDEEEQQSPSNEVKLKYEVKRLLETKLSYELKTGKYGAETKNVMKLLK